MELLWNCLRQQLFPHSPRTTTAGLRQQLFSNSPRTTTAGLRQQLFSNSPEQQLLACASSRSPTPPEQQLLACASSCSPTPPEQQLLAYASSCSPTPPEQSHSTKTTNFWHIAPDGESSPNEARSYDRSEEWSDGKSYFYVAVPRQSFLKIYFKIQLGDAIPPHPPKIIVCA